MGVTTRRFSFTFILIWKHSKLLDNVELILSMILQNGTGQLTAALHFFLPWSHLPFVPQLCWSIPAWLEKEGRREIEGLGDFMALLQLPLQLWNSDKWKTKQAEELGRRSPHSVKGARIGGLCGCPGSALLSAAAMMGIHYCPFMETPSVINVLEVQKNQNCPALPGGSNDTAIHGLTNCIS